MRVWLSAMSGLVVLAGSAAALACTPPAGPPPTPAQRAERLEQVQAQAWASAVLVFEAEIIDKFTIGRTDASRPALKPGVYVRVRPVARLKGEGAVEPMLFAYGPGPECTFGPSYQPRAGAVGGRFLFYAGQAEALRPDDLSLTMPVNALTNVETLAAYALRTSLN